MPHTAGQPAISRQRPPSRNLLLSTSVRTAIGRRRICRPLLGRHARVRVWPDAAFGLMQATRSAHTHLPCRHRKSELESEGYERPALPRQLGQPSNAFTGQFDPSSSPHRQNPCSRFAVDSLASQRPECQRCQSELECSQQPPALLGPRLGQTCRLANRAWPIAAGSIGPGGRGEGGINQRAGTPRLAT